MSNLQQLDIFDQPLWGVNHPVLNFQFLLLFIASCHEASTSDHAAPQVAGHPLWGVDWWPPIKLCLLLGAENSTLEPLFVAFQENCVASSTGLFTFSRRWPASWAAVCCCFSCRKFWSPSGFVKAATLPAPVGFYSYSFTFTQSLSSKSTATDLRITLQTWTVRPKTQPTRTTIRSCEQPWHRYLGDWNNELISLGHQKHGQTSCKRRSHSTCRLARTSNDLLRSLGMFTRFTRWKDECHLQLTSSHIKWLYQASWSSWIAKGPATWDGSRLVLIEVLPSLVQFDPLTLNLTAFVTSCTVRREPNIKNKSKGLTSFDCWKFTLFYLFCSIFDMAAALILLPCLFLEFFMCTLARNFFHQQLPQLPTSSRAHLQNGDPTSGTFQRLVAVQQDAQRELATAPLEQRLQLRSGHKLLLQSLLKFLCFPTPRNPTFLDVNTLVTGRPMDEIDPFWASGAWRNSSCDLLGKYGAVRMSQIQSVHIRMGTSIQSKVFMHFIWWQIWLILEVGFFSTFPVDHLSLSSQWKKQNGRFTRPTLEEPKSTLPCSVDSSGLHWGDNSLGQRILTLRIMGIGKKKRDSEVNTRLLHSPPKWGSLFRFEGFESCR